MNFTGTFCRPGKYGTFIFKTINKNKYINKYLLKSIDIYIESDYSIVNEKQNKTKIKYPAG